MLPPHLHPPLTSVYLDLAGILLGPQKSEGPSGAQTSVWKEAKCNPNGLSQV